MCQVWTTGEWDTCDCFLIWPVWRIRKEPNEQFPWRIWRWTNDGYYEPLMRCSSFEGARQLVLQMAWLRKAALRGDLRVR